eukprot:1156081-Pelagomonas_calceolata.AAC.13
MEKHAIALDTQGNKKLEKSTAVQLHEQEHWTRQWAVPPKGQECHQWDVLDAFQVPWNFENTKLDILVGGASYGLPRVPSVASF